MKNFIKILLGLACLSVVAINVHGGEVVTKLTARLSGTAAAAAASGKGSYEARSTRKKLSVEGEGLARFNGQAVTIRLGTTVLGSRTVALGRFDLNLDTANRQVVPTVAPGTAVTVSIGSTVVLTGRF